MQRLSSLFLLCLIAFRVGSAESPQEKIIGTGKSKRFVSWKYGFSVSIPAEWFVSVSGETPFYFNFPPNNARGQGELPNGGATINVTPQEELPSRRGRETIEDWAQTDEDQGVAETVSERVIQLPAETGVNRALYTSFDLKRYSVDEQAQQQVNIYWQFRKRSFATHLIFITGNPHAAELRELVVEIMKGVRPIENN